MIRRGMISRPVTLFLFLLICGVSFIASAEDDIPDALDIDRREAYAYRLELSPYGGDYFGDKINHSFVVGGNLQVNLTEKLAVATDFGYSRVFVDGTSRLGAGLTNHNEYLVNGGFVLTVPAAYRSRNNGVTEADFFTSIGGGIFRINGSNEGAGFIGGGMKIRPKIKWLAVRIEIRDYFTSLSGPGGGFENDLTLAIGPTFLLPPEM